MSEQLSFDEILEKVRQHWDIGTKEEIQTAYDLITDSAPLFPDEPRIGYFVYNYRYCAAALLDKPDLAIEIFQEGVDAGYWWNEDYLRSDEDLKSLQDLPAFNQLVEVCEQKRQAAMSKTKPLSLPLPLPAQPAEALPLLLALHGNTQNAENSVTFWESAVEEGWFTVMLQSSQISFTDAYVWDDLELGGREIKDHFDELAGKYQIDSGQVVIGGFSKGGEMAVWLTLMEILPVAGFISVNPGGPLINDVNQWLPLLENCKSLSEMRGYFVAGENDPNLENIKALHKLLVSRGMTCELVIAPAIAHDFPEDFSQTLAQALQYLCG
jgi:predicted esterase